MSKTSDDSLLAYRRLDECISNNQQGRQGLVAYYWNLSARMVPETEHQNRTI